MTFPSSTKSATSIDPSVLMSDGIVQQEYNVPISDKSLLLPKDMGTFFLPPH